jgi:glyoxylase-like metal-dependent hydrolase (beta-lactamase superfamily II)
MSDKRSFQLPANGMGQFSPERIILPTPFPVGPVNVYLLPSQPLTLVDTGPDTPEARSALTAALNKAGFAPRDIEQVVVTHAHSDHSGLASWFREMGAEVLLHPLEAEKLSGMDFWPVLIDNLQRLGVPDKLLTAYSLPRRESYRGGCLTDCCLLQEGDLLKYSGYRLSVLAVPGHCGGHLALYQEESGVLLAGDALLKRISPNPMAEVHPARPGERSGSLAQYLATLDKLGKLAFKLVLTGHGEALEEPAQRILEIKNHHRQRLQYIREMVRAYGPCTAFELAGRLYGRLSGWDILLAVSEVSAHLDWLTAHGALTETTSSGGRLTYNIIK